MSSQPDPDTLEAAIQTGDTIPEAVITIHQDLGNAGRVLFSLDLWLEQQPESDAIHTSDVVALALFNIARSQSQVFNDMYLAVLACITELSVAQGAGATPETLAAIREKHGIEFRAE